MTVLDILDLAEFRLAEEFDPSNDTYVYMYPKNSKYDLEGQRAESVITNFRLTVVQKDNADNYIRLAISAVSTDGTFQGKTKYKCTVRIADDSSTKMVGLANDDDGTDSVNNVIAANLNDNDGNAMTFSKNSPISIKIGVAEFNKIINEFSSSTNTKLAVPNSGTIESARMCYLNDSGKAVKGATSGKDIYISTNEATAPNEVTLALFYASGITVPGNIGDIIYGDDSTGVLGTTGGSGKTKVGSKVGSTILKISKDSEATELSEAQVTSPTNTTFGEVNGARLAKMVQESTVSYASSSEGDDDYVITLSPVPDAYYVGMPILLNADVANTGACTIDVNGLGVKNIKTIAGDDPDDGEVVAGINFLIYDGTNFVLQTSGKYVKDSDISSFVSGADATKTSIVDVSITAPVSAGAFDKTFAHGFGRPPKAIIFLDLQSGVGGPYEIPAIFMNGAYIGKSVLWSSSGSTSNIQFTSPYVEFDATNVTLKMTKTGTASWTRSHKVLVIG